MEKYDLWMARCIELAKIAAQNGEVPVGALIVHNNEIISEAYNQRENLKSPSAHAELLAIEAAAKKLNSWRLQDCLLVSSLEPCVMCAGAIIQSRIKTLVFGARDPKGGAESLFGTLSSEKLNHRVELICGVRDEECGELLKIFFKARRS